MVENFKIPAKKKERIPSRRVPDRPENLYLPKAEFVKWRKADNEAVLKAEEAYNKEMSTRMGSAGKVSLEEKKADEEMRKNRQLVATLAVQLKDLEQEISIASDVEMRSLKAARTRLVKKIEESELKVKSAEEAYERIRSQA